MNHKLFSSLTASLLIAILGVPLSSNARPSGSSSQNSEPKPKQISVEPGSMKTPVQASLSEEDVAKLDNQSNEVVKVGEQQSRSANKTVGDVVAKIYPHEMNGREAATLYVHNIPILTFKGAKRESATEIKIGTQESFSSIDDSPSKAKTLDEANSSNPSFASILQSSQAIAFSSDQLNLDTLDSIATTNDPAWRASVLAARINQIHRDGIEAEKISVSLDTEHQSGTERYLIKAGNLLLGVIDRDTILPDTTRNLERDALQATNRLRRLLGNANPLREVTGKPVSEQRQEIAFGPIRISLTGMASWYGPGFHGNPSASGERFNQNALTAAHRTLPFGTRVLVTNLDNGQSVVVRINDRGPFHGNRVIDLSMGAARVLGLVQSGVAPVRLEVIDPTRTVAAGN